ncbi:MAG TPA: hypothetical protein VGQ58_10690 [Candidatus Limnocylindrales bacterium]|jgi:hypothetical protein|nr:hypothetical protein [Candidatus Limnocylindrales bacterium]
MRRSNRGSIVAAFALVVGLASACGPGGSGSVSPSPQPTPLITPDPHLQDPASVDDVYQELAKAGLRITANTATIGTDGVTVKRINATYANWPLVLTEFKSTSARRVAARFDSGKPPRQGESPYMIAGMNILLEFGPHSTNDKTPAPPESAKVDAALDLVRALDPLLGPLEQRSTQPLPLPTPVLTPAPPTAAPAPS